MRRFLLQFGVWFGIALAFAFLMDAMISSGLRKTDIRKYAVWNDIYKGGLHSDIIVMGSSRAWCGYNTYILDSILDCDSYNLGLDGHQIDFQIIRYDTYCRFNDQPKVVLLNTDFLSTLGISADPQYEREQFFPFVHDGELMSRVGVAKNISWMDEHLPLVRYFGYRDEFENGIMAFLGKTDFVDGGLHKGYRGNEWGWNRGRILSKDTLVSASIDREAVNLLDSFANRLVGDGIKVVFVKSPVYYPLIERFTKIGESDSVFDLISRKYNIPILDYYHSEINSDSTNFYNPSHLSKKGSELFTFELCRDLDSLGILPPPSRR